MCSSDLNRSLVEGRAVPSATANGRSIETLVEKLTGKVVSKPKPKSSSLTNLFGLLRR